MGTKRYTDTFKLEAVRQVTEGGHGVYDVSNRLGVSSKSLYDWIKAYGPQSAATQAARSEQDEVRLDLVQYIEGYYNYQRRHSNNGGLSPKQFEDNYFR